MEHGDRPRSAFESIAADEHQRRRIVAASMLKATLGVTLLVVGYASLPLDGRNVALRVVIALLALLGALTVSVRYIATGQYPMMRAVESLVLVVSFAMVAFASAYMLLSEGDAAAFTEPLGHTDALYFAITTSTTVGFGDITPKTTGARIVVMVQMVVTVAVLGVGTRMLLATARRAGGR